MRARVLLAVALLTSARVAFAQPASRLTVVVLDPTEQPTPGATVTLERDGTPARLETTDGSGQTVFEALPAGTYRVGATLTGFGDATVSTVRVGRTGTVRVSLMLGAPRLSEAVTVGADVSSPA